MGTTAMPWLDFVVVDRYVMPPELTPYFAEKPLYVDGSFIPLTTQPAQPRTMTRQECGLPEDAFVMASFGNVYKINETLFTTWLELLREKPGSVLWLIDDNTQTTQNLRAYAAQAGVDASRIIFSPRTGYDDYRAKLRLIDVFLDTFPYNCGSTANDVIEAGIPMVTCSGKTLVSRMGGSILSALGQSHLIANSLPEYKQLVLAVARGDATALHTPASKERIHEICKSTVQSFEEGLSTLLAQTYAAGARA
jgi:predicted O-linked N-acetylglucosamine transferase (SPINDLY family)